MKQSLKWINSVCFAGMIVVNALANLLPFGGKTTAQVSQAYPNLFTPAPVTFSIWGIIYLLLLFFILYQWEFIDKSSYSSSIRNRIGILFPLSCLWNILWIIFWHFDRIGWSVWCIALLLLTLIGIIRRIKTPEGPILSRIVIHAGFEIYFGWIIAASIANISVFLVKIGWNGFGLPAQFWTVLVLLAGTGIASAAVACSRLYFSGAAVIWAYTGIVIRHFSEASGQRPWPVICAALVGIIIICFFIIWKAFAETQLCSCSFDPPASDKNR